MGEAKRRKATGTFPVPAARRAGEPLDEWLARAEMARDDARAARPKPAGESRAAWLVRVGRLGPIRGTGRKRIGRDRRAQRKVV